MIKVGFMYKIVKVGGLNHGPVMSKTEKLAPVVALDTIHHLRPRAMLVGPESV